MNNSNIRAAALAAFFMSAVLAVPAAGQPICGPRQVLLDNLAKHHNEAPIAIGLAASGQVVEVLVGPAGSWSIVVNNPDGRSCLMGAGEGWQDLERLARHKGNSS